MQEGGGLHIPQETVNATIAAGAAVFGGWMVWLAQRVMGKAAFQSAINEGFKGLLGEIQKERAADRVAWDAERARLNGDIANLRSTISGLKAMLRAAGIAIPPDWIPPSPDDHAPAMTVLPPSAPFEPPV